MKHKKLLSVTMAGLFAFSLNFTGALSSKVYAANSIKAKTDFAVPANNLIIATNDNNENSNLLQAFMKNTQITSEEVKQNYTLNMDFGSLDLDKLGVPKDQQPVVKMSLDMLKNIPITSNMKYVTNADKTKIEMESDNDISITGFDMPYKQWLNMDMTNSLPSEKIVTEIPDSIKPFLSMMSETPSDTSSSDIANDFTNKKYIVFDTSKLQQEAGAAASTISPDQYKEIIQQAQNFTGQFLTEIFKCAENTKLGIITKVSDNEYKISFNNVSIKALMEQALNDQTLTDGIVNYLVAVANVTSGQAVSQDEMKTQCENMLTSMKSSLPEMEKYMDVATFNLDENYKINNDGYICSEGGNFTITLNPSALAGKSDADLSSLAGLKISMDYSSVISNINGNVTLDSIPTLTSDNSIDLSDYLMNAIPKTDPSLDKEVKKYEEQAKAVDEINKDTSKWDKKQCQDTKKAWKINFNKELDPSTVDDISVMVIDNNFEPVECTVTCTGGTISVTPVNSYDTGKTYHIYLSTAIADKNGKHLPKAIHQDFVINP